MLSSQRLNLSNVCSKLLLLSQFQIPSLPYKEMLFKNMHVKNVVIDKLYMDYFTEILKKRMKNTCSCSSMDESQNLMLNEGSKTRKKYAVGYYSHMKL